MVIEERPINEETYSPMDDTRPVSSSETSEAAVETAAQTPPPAREQTLPDDDGIPAPSATIPGPGSAAAMEGAPTSYSEFYRESFAHALQEAIGYYVVCEFLVGNSIERKTGILIAAGVNFLTLQDPRNDSYTICDYYSLKFATIYNRQSIPEYDRTDNSGMHTERYNQANSDNSYYYSGRNRGTGYNRRW